MKIIITKNQHPIRKRLKMPILLEACASLNNDSIYGKNVELSDQILDTIKSAKEGFHIVTIGCIGLTMFSSICQFAFNINQRKQELLIKPILDKKETGCLFPMFKLTILPYRYRTNAIMTWDGRDITDGFGFTGNEIRKFISDAIIAERDYFKSKKVIFDFRDIGFEAIRYNNIAIDCLQKSFGNIEGDFYFISVNNQEFISKDEYLSYQIEYTEADKRYYHFRQIEIKQKEIADKLNRLELKRKAREPLIKKQNEKIENDRRYIKELSLLNTKELFIEIINSHRPIFFFYELINKQLEKKNLDVDRTIIEKLLEKYNLKNKKSKFYRQKRELDKYLYTLNQTNLSASDKSG